VAGKRPAEQIDRLLDAVELVQEGQRAAAVEVLRQLIREDSDFEDAWLWMSVAVEHADQAIICLENVLRVNPDNRLALDTLSRLRQSDVAQARQRQRLRLLRDLSFTGLWLLVAVLLVATFFGVMRPA